MASNTPVKLAFKLVEPKEGASDKPPIIFCHGMSSSKEHWDSIPKTISVATGRTVYAIDARNHGDSEWNDEFTYESNVNDLLHFMDNMGIQKATIVGHSMGGTTAMRTALRAPERVEDIIVEDIGCSKLPQQIADIIIKFFTLSTEALEQVPPGANEDDARKSMIEYLLKNKSPGLESLIKQESMNKRSFNVRRLDDGRLAFKSNMKVIGNLMKNRNKASGEPEGLFNGPACFIYGTLSIFNVKKDEEKIKHLFPNAELIPIENATHNVHADCPEEFVKVVLSFLQR